jgi:hypothetical protein
MTVLLPGSLPNDGETKELPVTPGTSDSYVPTTKNIDKLAVAVIRGRAGIAEISYNLIPYYLLQVLLLQ